MTEGKYSVPIDRIDTPVRESVKSKVGLVLSGGGARGAYEAGVLYYLFVVILLLLLLELFFCNVAKKCSCSFVM